MSVTDRGTHLVKEREPCVRELSPALHRVGWRPQGLEAGRPACGFFPGPLSAGVKGTSAGRGGDPAGMEENCLDVDGSAVPTVTLAAVGGGRAWVLWASRLGLES